MKTRLLSKRIVRWAVTFFGMLFLYVALMTAQAPSPIPTPDKKASEIFKNVQVLKDIPSDQLIPSMQFIASSLGVRCEYCHVEHAFDKDDKKPKQIARKMMQMMFSIDANNFEGRQAVTCNTCHRGSPKPMAIPEISETPRKLLNQQVPEAEANPPDLPKAADIIQKYVTAVGGADSIAKLSSIHAAGTFEAGGHQFPTEVFKKSPDRIEVVTHFPNGADNITVSDGTSGWTLVPGRLNAMNAAELDAARMDADLQLPLQLQKLFSEMRVEKNANDVEVQTIFISGRRSNLPPVEMYFDPQSGLLTRMVRYIPSALGMNPIQIDYSDYRDVAGVKLPFHWVSSTPTGRFTVQLASVDANPAIRDDMFKKPESKPFAAESK